MCLLLHTIAVELMARAELIASVPLVVDKIQATACTTTQRIVRFFTSALIS